jgi:hypothetical protein
MSANKAGFSITSDRRMAQRRLSARNRASAERPQLSVDADVSYQAFVENFDGVRSILGVFRRPLSVDWE